MIDAHSHVNMTSTRNLNSILKDFDAQFYFLVVASLYLGICLLY